MYNSFMYAPHVSVDLTPHTPSDFHAICKEYGNEDESYIRYLLNNTHNFDQK